MARWFGRGRNRLLVPDAEASLGDGDVDLCDRSADISSDVEMPSTAPTAEEARDPPARRGDPDRAGEQLQPPAGWPGRTGDLSGW